ncbi:glycosyltransferase [Streptomyces sp. NPDC001792]|uniref:glycosyltransferase n=1 Tax=Streptomyces sp. NPDC001792 TaxID=3154524 RepID=UPI0033171D89
MDFEHELLARFNVRISDDQAPPSDKWLAARIRIFGDLCLPSVRRQRRPRQQWFVFCNAQTPLR